MPVRMPARVAQLVLLTLLFMAAAVQAFKPHDFKTCATNAFCKRNRGTSLGAQFSIVPDSVSVAGAVLSATLQNSGSKVQLQLSLIAYDDGFVRLQVDEAMVVKRYRVPDVVMPEVEARRTTWAVHKKDGSSVGLVVGQSTVTLSYSPFKLAVSVGGTPAVVLNGRNLFNFEHRRSKQEGDPEGWWEETFNGHTDSKLRGPEALSLDLQFPGFEHVYGLPERATSLALKTTTGTPYNEPYRLYTLDVFEYVDDSPFGLYGAIPVMVAHKAGLTTGVLWLNAAEMYVDVTKQRDGTATQWIAESGIVDLFIFLGPTPKDLVQQYAKLTGPSAMPQLFSLGYHQCRWNYKDEADARAVDAGFDEHAIPYDVLWLDIEHTDGKRYLTWDQHHFPNPIKLQEDVAAGGRKMVTIVDPHVKRDHNYYIFSQAQAAGHFVKNKGNSDFDGWCWPGASSYLDVTSPAVRAWWATQFGLDKYVGSTKHLYIWNDMNEPSVFNGPEITMPKDNLHSGGVEHRDVHNVYGMFYHMATAEGLANRGKTASPDGDRPFVLSRAFFAGTQRVGPIWTGDNAADWSHLKVSVPMLLTLGLSGLPNVGADVGGFFGNPDAELLTRWYQLGIYYPFFRGHAHLETQRREPWLFGEPTTTRIRDAIRARYALLPYIYNLFREANVSGAPIMRPLWYEYPGNKDLFGVDEEFMLGPAMLVRPVVTAGASSVDVLLPRESRWFDAMTGMEAAKHHHAHKMQVTMEGIPAYYRGGHIVPRKERPRRSSATMGSDPLTLIVALNEKGEATGELYLDDGSSFAFQGGAYLHRTFRASGGVLLSEVAPQAEGTLPGTLGSEVIVERIVILGLAAPKRGHGTSAGGYKVKIRTGGGRNGQDLISESELEPGPASPRAPTSTAAFVLRAPKLRVADEWQVEWSL